MWQAVAVGVVVVVVLYVVAWVVRSHGTGAQTGAAAPWGPGAEVNYRQLVAHLPHASVLVVDRDLRCVLAEGEGRFDGVDSTRVDGELVGRLVHEVLTPTAWEVAGPHYRAALAGEMSEFDLPGGAGGEIHVRTLPLWGSGEVVTGVLVISERVAELRQTLAALQEALAFREAVLAASPDLMIVVDLESGEWEWTSRSVWSALGWPVGESVPVDPSATMRHVLDEDATAVADAWRALRTLPAGESVTLRFRLRGPDGTPRWLSCRATPFGRGEGSPRALAAVRDVTALVETERRLQQAALRDPLTGLPNRARLMELIASAVEAPDDRPEGLALLFCDVDGFKHINDTYGHAMGDAVLVEVARRLEASLRPGDSVARVGGDEFVALLTPQRRPAEEGHEPDAGSSTAFRAVAERIQHHVSRPIIRGGNAFVVTVSIGIAYVGGGSRATDLLGDADAAMYRAKRLGTGRIEVFDLALQAERDQQLRVETTLAEVLTATPPGLARLSVDYQPVFDIGSSRLVAFEALARLTDKHGQPIAPDDFIPVAEDIGFIRLLDQRVLDISLRALKEWTQRHPLDPPVKLAVNVSASQAHRANLADVIRAALLRHDVPPSSLVIEVTETVLVGMGTSTERQLRELHDLGVAIAIDDFGTGYASLQYLDTLPVDVIKVDRSFMSGLGTDATNTAIVRAVAALAAELDLMCIFEGIESAEQLAALPPGVFGQGFFLGHPEPGMRGDFRASPQGS